MNRRSSPRKKLGPIANGCGKALHTNLEIEAEQSVRPAIFEDLRDSILSDRLEKFIFALEELQNCLGLNSLKESISILAQLEVPVEYQDVQHALHYASRSGSLEVSKNLLDLNVNPDCIDKSAVGTWNGCTPLHVAANQVTIDCAYAMGDLTCLIQSFILQPTRSFNWTNRTQDRAVLVNHICSMYSFC